MIVIFMGPPGAGKGTQAQILQENLEIPILSTGHMLRAAIADGTEVGKVADSLMKNGDLVPDEIVIKIIKERIKQADCGKGFILDGFPRTLNQAQNLDKMLNNNNLIVDKVICLDVDTDVIVSRQAGRRVAQKSGCVYHLQNNPPKIPGKCDVSGEDLIQRDDDREDVVRHRINIYKETATPIMEHYKQKNVFYDVKGEGSLNEITTSIMNIIKK